MPVTFHGLRQDHDEFIYITVYLNSMFLHGHRNVQEMQFKFPAYYTFKEMCLKFDISWSPKCTGNAIHKFPVHFL